MFKKKKKKAFKRQIDAWHLMSKDTDKAKDFVTTERGPEPKCSRGNERRQSKCKTWLDKHTWHWVKADSQDELAQDKGKCRPHTHTHTHRSNCGQVKTIRAENDHQTGGMHRKGKGKLVIWNRREKFQNKTGSKGGRAKQGWVVMMKQVYLDCNAKNQNQIQNLESE